jgi:hypothetical protein
MHLEAWERRHARGDRDIPKYFYERPDLDAVDSYYLRAWYDLVPERPIIATMASVSEGVIPRSKIKTYAQDDLGLVGEEVEFFIDVMRRVEAKSKAPPAESKDPDPVKGIVKRLASQKDSKSFHHKKPRVRQPR